MSLLYPDFLVVTWPCSMKNSSTNRTLPRRMCRV